MAVGRVPQSNCLTLDVFLIHSFVVNSLMPLSRRSFDLFDQPHYQNKLDK